MSKIYRLDVIIIAKNVTQGTNLSVLNAVVSIFWIVIVKNVYLNVLVAHILIKTLIYVHLVK